MTPPGPWSTRTQPNPHVSVRPRGLPQARPCGRRAGRPCRPPRPSTEPQPCGDLARGGGQRYRLIGDRQRSLGPYVPLHEDPGHSSSRAGRRSCQGQGRGTALGPPWTALPATLRLPKVGAAKGPAPPAGARRASDRLSRARMSDGALPPPPGTNGCAPVAAESRLPFLPLPTGRSLGGASERACFTCARRHRASDPCPCPEVLASPVEPPRRARRLS